jgi:hypothetical protein
MVSRLILPIALICLLFQFSGCKKEDTNNLLVSNSKLTFDYSEQEKTITVSDAGSSEFTWTVSSPSDLLKFSKTSGSCSKNNPDDFKITLLREKVHQDSITTTVTITASTGETASIALLILGFPEKKIRYGSQIYDAGYDRVHNRLVMLTVSNSAWVLDILDIGTSQFTHIPLPGNGELLSVSPDGLYAVTSSNNNSRITYTDLVQNKIINTFSVEQFSHDIIATTDKFCYYFPYYNNSDIGKLNLNTGAFASYNVTTSNDLSAAVLHPSGYYIYTAGYYSLGKIKISGPVPTLIYTNSNYSTDSKLWVSGDGTRLFTAARKMLNIDPSLPQNDITSDSDVPIGQSYIYTMENNLPHNEFYIIPSNSSYGTDSQSRQLLVLDNDLATLRSITLEPFFISNSWGQPGYTTVDAVGKYVFSSSDGNKIIVISSADSYSSTWGIEIIDRTWK